MVSVDSLVGKPTVLKYLKESWIPFKEHFVAAYTDPHLHLGQRTTSRVESSHHILKSHIHSRFGDMKTAFHGIHLAVTSQHQEIKAKIGDERIKFPFAFSDPLFSLVVKKISQFALQRTKEQHRLALDSQSTDETCTGLYQASMGLPCKHVIRQVLKGSGKLSLDHFNHHWWIQERQDVTTPVHNEDVENFLQEVTGALRSWPPHEQQAYMHQTRPFLNGPTAVIRNPVLQRKRGRPKLSSTGPDALEIRQPKLRNLSEIRQTNCSRVLD